MKKICVVTGSRSDYGLLRWVMEGIKKDPGFKLQLIVTGMHLSSQFGLTYLDIEKDGFHINQKVEILLSSDTRVSIAKSMGLGMIGFSEAINKLKPDLFLVLGDRYEIFAAVSAAMIASIPIAHLHGGEASEGAFDESIRHSITKMSHFHFVAAEEYRKRVIQLGEHPDRVFLVGGLGVENIHKLELLGKKELEESLQFHLGRKNLLVTFHPVTLEKNSSAEQMKELLEALDLIEDVNFIFTMPNSDTDSLILFKLIEEFVFLHPNSKAFKSLGQLLYLSCVKHIDGVIGNSSSGLCEVPSFQKGTINIGDRQKGRLKADSVIDCKPEKLSIKKAINELFSKKFQNKLHKVQNPYGSGGASESILEILKNISLDDLLKKEFYNISQ